MFPYTSGYLQQATTTASAESATLSPTSKQATANVFAQTTATGVLKQATVKTTAEVIQSGIVRNPGLLVQLCNGSASGTLLQSTVNSNGEILSSSGLVSQPTMFSLLFGKNAIQNATSITIQKSDLSPLIASPNNRSTALLVALIANRLNATNINLVSNFNFYYYNSYFTDTLTDQQYESKFYSLPILDNFGNIQPLSATPNPNNF